MDCPKCDAAMTTRTEEQVTVDRCAACGGWWLDAGELDQLTSRRGSVRAEAAFVSGPPTKLHCTRCERSALHFGKIGRVTVERCVGCRGLFLDWGELERIREQALSLKPNSGPSSPHAGPASSQSAADGVDIVTMLAVADALDLL